MTLASTSTPTIVIGVIVVVSLFIPIVGAWRGTYPGRGLDKLVEEATGAQKRTAEELAGLSARIAELERLLKEVG